MEICVGAFDHTSQQRLCNYLADTWGICPRLRDAGVRKVAVLTLS